MQPLRMFDGLITAVLMPSSIISYYMQLRVIVKARAAPRVLALERAWLAAQSVETITT